VGYATETFHQNYHSETALGNLITDAVLTESRKKSDVDFVLMNSGGLRNDFQKGLITYGDIFKVLPFDNSLTIIDFTGAELRQLLEIAYSGSNGMPPSSGLKIRRYDVKASDNGPWNRDINGDGKYETWERNLIVNLEDSQGKPIESNSIYQVATIDFLVQGAEHQDTVYTKLHQDRIHKYTGVWIRDLFENYLKKLKTVSPSHYYDPNNPRIQLIPFKN
jgi:2',3'-cyclic-nucleotide 2'-phosphodiesterase (5'-nucleotidase family)